MNPRTAENSSNHQARRNGAEARGCGPGKPIQSTNCKCIHFDLSKVED
jgi:hypothetical protein